MYLANPSDTACNEVGEETGCSFAAAEYALPGLAPAMWLACTNVVIGCQLLLVHVLSCSSTFR